MPCVMREVLGLKKRCETGAAPPARSWRSEWSRTELRAGTCSKASTSQTRFHSQKSQRNPFEVQWAHAVLHHERLGSSAVNSRCLFQVQSMEHRVTPLQWGWAGEPGTKRGWKCHLWAGSPLASEPDCSGNYPHIFLFNQSLPEVPFSTSANCHPTLIGEELEFVKDIKSWIVTRVFYEVSDRTCWKIILARKKGRSHCVSLCDGSDHAAFLFPLSFP